MHKSLFATKGKLNITGILKKIKNVTGDNAVINETPLDICLVTLNILSRPYLSSTSRRFLDSSQP